MKKNKKQVLKLETQSQILSENNKPWYKSKNTIIGVSSLLGAGVLATVIAVPIALSNNSTAVVNKIKETLNILNSQDNKIVRTDVWKKFMNSLSVAPSPLSKVASLDTIVRTDSFIKEFVIFLLDNLFESDEGTETGAIKATDVDNLKLALYGSPSTKDVWKDASLVTYTNLFQFDTQPMMNYKDSIDSTVVKNELSLTMPIQNLDLVFNNDGTVSIKTLKISSTASENVSLKITKSSVPGLSNKQIYFKPEKTFVLPKSITNTFSNFLEKQISEKEGLRSTYTTGFANIKSSIDNDTSNATGLSYWNSFAINYATFNSAFLAKDIMNESSFLLNFLKLNSKNGEKPLSSVELDEIKKEVSTTATANISATPFVSSPTYFANDLFDTSNITGNKYSLNLNITSFNYKFAVGNLFEVNTAINVTPMLTMSGILTKVSNEVPNSVTKFTIPKNSYDVSALVDKSSMVNLLTSGALTGYFGELMDPNSEMALVTNSLVNLNNKNIDQQIAFWNDFSTMSNATLFESLKAPNVFHDFIFNNIDVANPFGNNSVDFPNISKEVFELSLKEKLVDVTDADFNFKITAGSTTPIPAISIPKVKWGPLDTDFFANISIYFGYEKDSMSNFNVTSGLASKSNVSFSQINGETVQGSLNDDTAISKAASKRISIVFKAPSTNYVFYFGQFKNSDTPIQENKPIIFPESILTAETKFIESVKLEK